MKVLAQRAELLALCRHASRIASEASPVKALQGILLEADEENQTLTTTVTNFEVSLRCQMKAEVKESGARIVNARMLTGMLGLLQGDNIALYGKTNGTMLLAGGTCRYSISVLPGRSYPKTELPFPEDTVQVSGIPALSKRTSFVVAEDDTKPVMRCVNLIFSENGLRAVGSDGLRVMSVRGEAKSAGAVSLLVPAKSLATLAGMVTDQDTLMVGTTGQAVVFMRENFIYSARLMPGAYINTDALLGSVKGAFTVLSDAEALWRAVDGATSVANEHGKVCLSFDGSTITLSCVCAEGTAKNVLDVVPLVGTPVGSYHYQAKKLMECLRALSGTLKLQIAQSGILLMETEAATCLQSATRAPSTQDAQQKKPSMAA